jgi:hypothetical protein
MIVKMLTEFFDKPTKELWATMFLRNITSLSSISIGVLSYTNSLFLFYIHKFVFYSLSDTSRVAKHGLFFFGLYLCPKFAESMVKPKPQLNPYKFKKFYETVLPKYFNQLLNGEITSLQKFVEEVRAEYIMCGI